MPKDEEDGVAGSGLQAKAEFDHFGAKEKLSAGPLRARPAGGVRGHAESIIGPAPHEFIEASINDPVGRRLLRTMGWRESKKKFR